MELLDILHPHIDSVEHRHIALLLMSQFSPCICECHGLHKLQNFISLHAESEKAQTSNNQVDIRKHFLNLSQLIGMAMMEQVIDSICVDSNGSAG